VNDQFPDDKESQYTLCGDREKVKMEGTIGNDNLTITKTLVWNGDFLCECSGLWATRRGDDDNATVAATAAS